MKRTLYRKGEPLYSGRDVNDALMIAAGFARHPHLDQPKFNACGNITYWLHKTLRINIVTSKDKKLTLPDLLHRVANQVAGVTRRRIKDKVAAIDFGEDRFIPKSD